VRVGGVVVDRNGQRVPHVQLTVLVAQQPKMVRAEADGTWMAGGLGNGEITVQVSDWSGFIRQPPLVVTPGDLNVRIVVERGESIAGTVTGGEDDAMQGVRVEAIDENGEVAATGWIWRQNRDFSLRGLRRGKYLLRVSRIDGGQWKTLAEAEGVATGTDGVELTIE
jgi:hypothetical protein